MDRDYAVDRLKSLKKNNQLFSDVCNFAIKILNLGKIFKKQ